MMAVTRDDTASASVVASPSRASLVTSPATTRTDRCFGVRGSTCASAITSSTDGRDAISSTRARPTVPVAPVTRITAPLTAPSCFEEQARPTGAESEGEQQQTITSLDPAAIGRVFQVDEVVRGNHVPFGRDVVGKQPIGCHPQQRQENLPAPQRDVVRNDERDVVGTQTARRERVANDRPCGRKVRGDNLVLASRGIPVIA